MESMTEHTAGQWRAIYHEPGNTVQKGLAGYSIQTPAEGIAFNVCREANANLIAAAPELLRTAKVMVKFYDEFLYSEEFAIERVASVDPLREAIATAEGSAD